jgi:HMG (high mobility group) box
LKTDSDGVLKESVFHDTFLSELYPEEPVLKKSARKRLPATLRKAPNAPKRFKSSYICFFMEKQPGIKEELGSEATVTNISKRAAELWKSLSAEDRTVWDDVAAQDKQRYMIEKSQYTGPWQIPWKRPKKDPSAPKRPMSAFLYFSQGKRAQIKKEKPDIKNTEVSRLLGEMWRNMTGEERAPHIDRERREREIYKVAMAEWKEHHDAMKQFEGPEDSEMGLEGQEMIHLDHLGNPYSVPLHQISKIRLLLFFVLCRCTHLFVFVSFANFVYSTAAVPISDKRKATCYPWA